MNSCLPSPGGLLSSCHSSAKPTVPQHGPREKLKNEIGHETAKKWAFGGFNKPGSKVSVWWLRFWLWKRAGSSKDDRKI